ncbi:hypothetical protein ATCC90586_006982 [Pythium insidiosum]|nr:hypothetical protein ATCC90586_006982 [Pythium insidiosum]
MSLVASAPMTLARRLDLPGAGIFFFTGLLIVSWLLNVVLVLVPFGAVAEIALLVWAAKYDRVAFNGQGRPSLAFRRAWAYRSYFPVSLRQEEPLDASKRYIFGIHPHGILGFGAWMTFAADTVGLSSKNGDLDIALATVKSNFFVPFWRDILLAVGFVDAGFQSLRAVLQRQRSVAVVVGGAAEALHAHPGTNDLILHKRKGFVRLALVTGTPLVPVFMFGENDLFYQVPNPKGSLLYSIQKLFLRRFKFSPPLPVGVGILGCPVGSMPRRVPLHVVTGAPLAVSQSASPTDDEVNQAHARYCASLEQLYAKHAVEYYTQILPENLRPSVLPKLRIIE